MLTIQQTLPSHIHRLGNVSLRHLGDVDGCNRLTGFFVGLTKKFLGLIQKFLGLTRAFVGLNFVKQNAISPIAGWLAGYDKIRTYILSRRNSPMPTLNFKGKSVVRTHHLTIPYRQLTPDPARSLTAAPSLNDNLIVHGDNLLALKALMPSFSSKIKCIYIDPPYNTGNENWVYNDNVNSPMHQDWLKKVVDREDLTRHDKWLCMMWPRLTLLKELLAEDGAIFVSIDDNEAHHLRNMMDEIFGEENFVGMFVWKRRSSSSLAESRISQDHEYVICYAKSAFESFAGIPKDYLAYSNPDSDAQGD